LREYHHEHPAVNAGLSWSEAGRWNRRNGTLTAEKSNRFAAFAFLRGRMGCYFFSRKNWEVVGMGFVPVARNATE
jgi:hypothetical protein